jgi:hypothetical protein
MYRHRGSRALGVGSACTAQGSWICGHEDHGRGELGTHERLGANFGGKKARM